jgi:hypothetical protein
VIINLEVVAVVGSNFPIPPVEERLEDALSSFQNEPHDIEPVAPGDDGGLQDPAEIRDGSKETKEKSPRPKSCLIENQNKKPGKGSVLMVTFLATMKFS